MSFQKSWMWFSVIALLVLCNGAIWYAVYRSERDVLTLAFLDVGQGDAIYIEAPNGNQVLIDGGPNTSVLRELGRVMPFYDRSLDVVIETHPDADHIGGLTDVFQRFEVEYFLEPGIPNDTIQTVSLENNVSREEGLTSIKARRGMMIDLGRGASLQVLFPDRDVSGVETNTGSVIVKLIYGSTSALLTGDSPRSIESYLIAQNASVLESDILKLGHHGSHTSTSREFVEAVSPGVAIISAGKDNRYGHPHKEVLEALQTAQVPYVSTAELGTIQFESDGNVFRKK